MEPQSELLKINKNLQNVKNVYVGLTIRLKYYKKFKKMFGRKYYQEPHCLSTTK